MGSWLIELSGLFKRPGNLKKETKARFCASLQAVEEVLVEYWKGYVDQEKLIEAGGILRDLDLIETVRAKLKCPE